MQPRIQPLDPTATDNPSREILAAIQAKIGMVPNLYRVLGHSPAALQAYLGLGDALGKGALDAGLREKLAVAISQENGCGYCLAAHTLIGEKMAGVPAAELALARRGQAADARERAILELGLGLVRGRGRVDDALLARTRVAGVREAEIVEVVAHVAALTFSNYLNHLARTPLDFPEVEDMPQAA
jgi:uncharacterized peroxidase-related enzyme